MTSASASRVTRSRRSLQLTLLLSAGVLAGITVLRAQEAPPAVTAGQPATSSQPAETPPPAANPPAKEVTGAADAADKSAQPAAPAGSSPSRFEPTEKVRADFDVSFPIDI